MRKQEVVLCFGFSSDLVRTCIFMALRQFTYLGISFNRPTYRSLILQYVQLAPREPRCECAAVPSHALPSARGGMRPQLSFVFFSCFLPAEFLCT